MFTKKYKNYIVNIYNNIYQKGKGLKKIIIILAMQEFLSVVPLKFCGYTSKLEWQETNMT